MNQTSDKLHVSADIGRQWLLSKADQCARETPTQSTHSYELDFPMIAIPYFEISDAATVPKNGTSSRSLAAEASAKVTCNSGDVHATMASASSREASRQRTAGSVETSKSSSRRAWPPADRPSETPLTFEPKPAPIAARAVANDAVDGLIDAILERFPLAAPSVLLFVGSENNSHTDSTTKLVAESLAGCNIGNVLLVDSNRDGNLTEQHSMRGEHGVTNLLLGGAHWQSLVASQRSAGLDFLPVGDESWERWGGAQRLRAVVAEMKQHFQFICVSAGDAHLPTAKLWSGICDGSYLLVSLVNSNQTIAESAVAELQSNGARLLGCVVTDAA